MRIIVTPYLMYKGISDISSGKRKCQNIQTVPSYSVFSNTISTFLGAKQPRFIGCFSLYRNKNSDI